MNNDFEKIPEEKRDLIVKEAYKEFALYGYDNASIVKIQQEAGVSRGYLFHFFKNKKEFFFYIVKKFEEDYPAWEERCFAKATDDLFDAYLNMSKINREITKKNEYHWLFSLQIMRFTYQSESTREVFHDNADDWENAFLEQTMPKINIAKFKEGIDPKYVFKLLVWSSYGIIFTQQWNEDFNFINFYHELEKIVTLLKEQFYKPEYLTDTKK